MNARFFTIDIKLVTSAYFSDIKDFSKKSEYLKIFYKSDIVDIPVELIDGNSNAKYSSDFLNMLKIREL